MQQVYRRLATDRNVYKALCTATVLLFPVILVLIAENTHLQSLRELTEFITGSWKIFLYDILFVGAVFAGLSLLLRHVWVAMLLQGAALYTLSLVEFFKYNANGSHFSVADLVMAGKVSDVARFAQIDVSSIMVANLAVLIAYVLWAAFLRIQVPFGYAKAMSMGAGVFGALAVVIATPMLYTTVYGVFGVDYQTGYDPYASNETFQSNMQIAFLSQDISTGITRRLAKPQGYSRRTINSILPGHEAPSAPDGDYPDLIIIMSEAYTDFRRFDKLDVPKNTYANFDKLAREGFRGDALAPTFGGYTCKTEYELLFGLPVKGINDEAIPHQLFTDGKPRPTFAGMLREMGYGTSFIHPFSASFYNRDKAYQSYGFDKLRFEDSLTVRPSRLGSYIDDHTLVEQIKAELEQGEQPRFVFAVSMQNHGPYTGTDHYALADSRLSEGENAELGRYLYGIKKTDQALGELASYLRGRSRPAVVLFVGDHYPYLGKQGKLYEKLGKAASPYSLYQQPYLLWSSRPTQRDLPGERVSTFYLPHIVADYAGLPKDRFMTDMYQMMQTTPLFTFDAGGDSPDAHALMQLTYDRTKGEGYSALKT